MMHRLSNLFKNSGDGVRIRFLHLWNRVFLLIFGSEIKAGQQSGSFQYGFLRECGME